VALDLVTFRRELVAGARALRGIRFTPCQRSCEIPYPVIV